MDSISHKDVGGFVYACTDTDMIDFQRGITRRHWLAGLAMQGLTSQPQPFNVAERIEVAAYRIADAMIEEGNK